MINNNFEQPFHYPSHSTRSMSHPHASGYVGNTLNTSVVPPGYVGNSQRYSHSRAEYQGDLSQPAPYSQHREEQNNTVNFQQLSRNTGNSSVSIETLLANLDFNIQSLTNRLTTIENVVSNLQFKSDSATVGTAGSSSKKLTGKHIISYPVFEDKPTKEEFDTYIEKYPVMMDHILDHDHAGIFNEIKEVR